MRNNPRTWSLTILALIFAVVLLGPLHAPVFGQEPHPAVLHVKNDTGRYTWGTSGVVINHAGGTYALTCGHLFSDGVGRVTVSGRPAKPIAIDLRWDLAVLECADLNPEYAFQISTSKPKVGDQITCVGWGEGLGHYRAVRGRVTQYLQGPGQQGNENLEVSCTTRSGDSGGPMIDTQGHLVGILWGSDSRIATGIYCGRIKKFLDANLPIIKPVSLTASGFG